MAPSSFSVPFLLHPPFLFFPKSNKNKTESHYVAQAINELIMPLPWLPKCWGYRQHTSTPSFSCIQIPPLSPLSWPLPPRLYEKPWKSLTSLDKLLGSPPPSGGISAASSSKGQQRYALLSAVQLGREQVPQACPGLASMAGIFMVRNWEGVSCSC